MAERLMEEIRRIAPQWNIVSGVEQKRGFTFIPEIGRNVPKFGGTEENVLRVVIPGLKIEGVEGKTHRIALTVAAQAHGGEHYPKMTIMASREVKPGEYVNEERTGSIVSLGGPTAPTMFFSQLTPQVGLMEFKTPQDLSKEHREKILAFLRALHEELKPR